MVTGMPEHHREFNNRFVVKAKPKAGKKCFECKSAGGDTTLFMWFQVHEHAPYWCLGSKEGVIARMPSKDDLPPESGSWDVYPSATDHSVSALYSLTLTPDFVGALGAVGEV